MTEYLMPTCFGEAEFVEKRSRFIGHVWPVESEEEAREKIAETKSKYHDARHNCWCYIIKDREIVRYSDDGEPQGTAGKPMLDVFRHEGIENVCCVVTRYFGGILLGAGGLTRAYSHAAKIAAETAGTSVMRIWKLIDIPCQYNMLERVKNELAAFDGLIESAEYGAEVMIHAFLPEKGAEDFCSRISDISSGTTIAVIKNSVYMSVPKN